MNRKPRCAVGLPIRRSRRLPLRAPQPQGPLAASPRLPVAATGLDGTHRKIASAPGYDRPGRGLALRYLRLGACADYTAHCGRLSDRLQASTRRRSSSRPHDRPVLGAGRWRTGRPTYGWPPRTRRMNCRHSNAGYTRCGPRGTRGEGGGCRYRLDNGLSALLPVYRDPRRAGIAVAGAGRCDADGGMSARSAPPYEPPPRSDTYPGTPPAPPRAIGRPVLRNAATVRQKECRLLSASSPDAKPKPWRARISQAMK
jgi:hypothetical protein